MRCSRLTALALVLALGVASGGVWAAQAPEAIPIGPELRAVDPSTGEAVALDPAQGPLHVVFIATWCRPCLAELPRLFDLEDRWKQDGYRLVLVAVSTRQSRERLVEFLAQGPVPGRLLFDSTGTVAAAFGATTIPVHILTDRSGRVVARAGTLDADFRSAVERLVRQEGRPGRP